MTDTKNLLNQFYNKTVDKVDTQIDIYGSIGNGLFGDVNASNVKEKIAKTTGDIKLNINSPGGDVFESVAIHNLLKSHKGNVTAYVDGLAASGASIIAMAADKIVMPSNSMLMIHNAWTFAMGNASELREVADQLEQIDTGAVKESYASRFNGSAEELDALLSKDSFITAQEAVNNGLADEIAQEEPKDEDEETVQEETTEQVEESEQQEPVATIAASANKMKDTAKVFEDFLNAFK